MKDSDQSRSRQNLGALVLLVLIALLGTLLFFHFTQSIAIMKCVTSGRPDCIVAPHS